MPNALKELNRYGQSVWLDYIRRSLIVSGELRRLIDEDGLRGVTSNPAVKTLISEGINVNVTLLFHLDAYEKVAEAYISGLEAFVAKGGDPRRVESVASFFISRIDSAIDTMIDARLKASDDAIEQALLKGLMGRVAIANARLTYQRYKDLYLGERWAALAGKGARSQRLLWASTSSKNPNYRDVVYVEELIGPDTVDTIPPATYDAFRDHGRVRPSLDEDFEDAQDTMDTLAKVGIDMKQVTDTLLVDGCKIFVDAFAKLLAAVNKQLHTPSEASKRQSARLPAELAA